MTDIPTKTLPDPSGIDVSVVIPVYNCEKYLHETIGSVRAQDMHAGSVEIVAVDDGSTDDSLNILNELAAVGNDLRVYSIPNSGSAAAPRNVGLEQARGRYVFFLDADDKFSSKALSRLTHVADNTGSGVVLGKMGLFGENRAGSVPSTAFGRTLLAVDFVESKAHSTLGAWKLFRRSILMDYDIRFPLGYKIGEDQPFTMKAYLHSPHISILTDQVYYWLRGRDDGTNITAIGQPPRKHLSRILTLIQTIVDNTEPGERRDQLLRRPIVGSSGVTSVFGRKMLPAHTRVEREEMLAEFREVVTPLWNPRIRERGTIASQILVDLAVRGDLDGIETISQFLLEKMPIPVTHDSDRGQFVYAPSKGESIGDLKIKPEATLETISSVGRCLKVRGEIGIPGADVAPDSAKLIFRHCKLGTKVVLNLDVTRTYTRSFGTRARFSAKIDSSKLNDSGVWEAAIKANWSSTVFRQPFGGLRSNALKTSPLLIGDPTEAIAFFTRNERLAIDVGPTEKHLDPVDSSELRIIDDFQVGRSVVLVLNGAIDNLGTASISTENSSKVKPAELVIHSSSQASIVVPRSLTKRQGWTIQLTDKVGNIVVVQPPDVISC